MKKLVICILCSCIFFVSCKNNATAEKFYLSAVDSYAEHDFENALVFLQPNDIALTGTHFSSIQVFSSKEMISSVSSRKAKIFITSPTFNSARFVLVARQLT